MWKRIDESQDELTEEEVINDLEVAYRQLEKVKAKLDQCYDVELREKYMRNLCDFMNWLDYEI